jgi:hypothetical protein
MTNLILAACLWGLSFFFFYFAYSDIRDGFTSFHGIRRVDRHKNPINFWSGMAVLFIAGTLLIVLGVLFLLGIIKLRNSN